MIKQRKTIRLALASITLSILALGGCSDNQPSSGSSAAKADVQLSGCVQRQVISQETSNNDIPNIFADCTTLSAKQDNANCVVSAEEGVDEQRLADDEAGQLPVLDTILNTPARVDGQVSKPYFISTNNGEETSQKLVIDTDVKGFDLQGGQRYSLTFEDIDHCGLSCLDFHPTVQVLSQADYEAEDFSKCLDLELISQDPQNRYVSLSFVPASDGVYCVAISDASTTPGNAPASEDFCYNVYPDAEKVGMSLILSDDQDGQSFDYTNSEIQDLRASLRPYVESWENGFPTTLSDKTINGLTWQEAYQNAKESIKLAHANKQSNASEEVSALEESEQKTTILEPFVDKQVWSSGTMSFGEGLSATTGMAAPKINAIKTFQLDTKDRKPFNTNTYMRLIENSSQQEQAMGVSVSGTFSGGPATVKTSVDTRDVYKYSATSTTLQIYYENCATSPTKLDNQEYQLTDEAKALLASNPDQFRATYGDYFVAGAYYGAKYVGNIAIRTSSTEHLNSVKQQLSALIYGQKIDEEFTRELKDVVSNCDIALSVHTEGGSDVPTEMYYDSANDTWTTKGPVYSSTAAQSALSIEALIQGYGNFKANVEASPNPNLTEIYAYLLEFSQIPDCSALSNELPIDPETFIAMRNICRSYWHLCATLSEYLELPSTDFRDGRNYLEQVHGDAEDLCTRFKADLRQADKNLDSFIAKWSEALNDANKISDARLERYYFVRRLEEANAAIKTNSLQANRNVLFGYSQYLYSKICNDDFIGTSEDHKHKDWKVGRHYWSPRLKAPDGQNGIAAGIEWTNHSNCDSNDFTYYPPLCRPEVGVDCEGGYVRDVNWDIKVSWINADNYGELILPTQKQ